MKSKQILFTQPNVAELVDVDIPGDVRDGQVLVKTEFTAVSAGTERANLIGEKNISGVRAQCAEVRFPRALGYSGAGIVEKVGSGVSKVRPGDRVVIYFGLHRQHNLVDQANVHRIEYDTITSLEAAFVVIAGFSIAGVRKTKLEIGESALVMGLGILGQFAVQICRGAGAVPVIAADPNPERRALATALGADHVIDPAEPGFAEKVRSLTGGTGVNAIVEVTGVAAALSQALDCATRFARVALLGCTRNPDVPLDLYHQVHYPGVSLVGANNFARPSFESSPGNWTFADDCAALLKLIAGGRLAVQPLLSAPHSPREAPEVYRRLACDYANFPMGVAFDWSKLD